MPATHTRSNAFTPPPNSAETGIMPDLYRLSVGPLHAAYYQQQFQRFETLGKAVPSWNSAAAFFTLAWMVLRKQWRFAALYAVVWVAVVAAWALGIHARVPIQVEATACLLALLLLCAVPGFLANGWYYHRVRHQTLDTLTRARSIGQARAQLIENGIDRQRLYAVAAAHVFISVALATLLYHHLNPALATSPAPSGPPQLVIPSVHHVQPLPSPPLMEVALPEADTEHAPPASAPTSAPAEVTTAMTAAVETTLPSPPAQEAPEPAAAPPVEAPAAAAAAAATSSAATAVAATSPSTTAITPAAVPAKPLPPAAPAKKSITPEAKPAVAAKAAKTAKTPVPPTPAPVGGLVAGKYYLNAGVYAQAANADRAVKQLQAAKLSTLRQTVSGRQGSMTRLRIGPFDTRQQAEQAAATAQRLRIESSVFQQPHK